MKKKIIITLASLAAVGAAVAGCLHISNSGLLVIAISGKLWYVVCNSRKKGE